MDGETRLRRHVPIVGALLVAFAVGCAPPDSVRLIEGSPDASVELTPEPVRTLSLLIQSDEAGQTSPGALRLLIEEENSDQIVDRWLADESEEWPFTVALEALPPGPIRLTVYRDRDGDGGHDPCPFPPDPNDPEIADTIDNVSATILVRSAAQREAAVTLRRHICGPGDLTTGLSGALSLPAEAELSRDVPIIAMVVPYVPADGHGGEAAAMGLHIPLFPEGIGDTNGPAPFSIGELLPGRYRLVIFTDDDDDGQPTPCGPDLGGGDRLIAIVDPVDVTRDEFSELSEVVLMAKECPGIETGIRGVISIDEQYAAMAADPQMDAPSGALRGPVIAVVSRVDGEEEVSWRVLESIWERPLPHTFTVTGLTPGLWRLRVFLDRDGDGRFSPCEGLGAGLDAVDAMVDEVEIVAGQLSDVGELRLGVGRCADELPTGVSGRISLEREEGAIGSGRPVRLELYPSGDRNEHVSVQLIDNHWSAGGEAAFSHAVAPGRYMAQVYIDTNRDGEFTSCRGAPFGDRAASQLVPLDVLPGQLVDLGLLPVDTIGCPTPPAEVRPILALPMRGAAVSFDGLTLHLVEAGGWMEEMNVDLGVVEDRVRLPALPLAPGQYRMTATLMNVVPRADRECNQRVRMLVASVEFHLDEMTPVVEPELRVMIPCNE